MTTDYTLNARNDLLSGMQGSGKTTFVIRLLLNSNPACRFIFDDENRTAPRLGIKPCYTEAEFENALALRWCVFNPSRMFLPMQGDRDMLAPKRRAFRWFCSRVFEICGRGPGVKMVSVPEIWRFCTPDSIPPEFAMLMQMGRELNVHMILDTQRPELVNGSVTGQATELICFKLLPSGQSLCPLRTIERLGADAAQIADLRPGQWVSLNRLTGQKSQGRLF